jgi:hypothetical protein
MARAAERIASAILSARVRLSTVRVLTGGPISLHPRAARFPAREDGSRRPAASLAIFSAFPYILTTKAMKKLQYEGAAVKSGFGAAGWPLPAVLMFVLLCEIPSTGICQDTKDASPKINPSAERAGMKNDSSDITPAKIHSLPVRLRPQETENWCWAACGQMVMEYLGRDISQCEQANNRYDLTGCCIRDLVPLRANLSKDDSSLIAYVNCARSGWPEFEKYNFASKRTTNAALKWDELKAQLSGGPDSRGRPVVFSWRWKKGGGHMMVAKGYTSIDGQNYVIILDPWPPNKGDEIIIPYSAYVEDPGNYSHWDDFYDLSITRPN